MIYISVNGKTKNYFVKINEMAHTAIFMWALFDVLSGIISLQKECLKTLVYNNKSMTFIRLK